MRCVVPRLSYRILAVRTLQYGTEYTRRPEPGDPRPARRLAGTGLQLRRQPLAVTEPQLWEWEQKSASYPSLTGHNVLAAHMPVPVPFSSA